MCKGCRTYRSQWTQPLTLWVTSGQALQLSEPQFPHLCVPFQPHSALTMGTTPFGTPALPLRFTRAFLQRLFIERLLYAWDQQLLGQPRPVHSAKSDEAGGSRDRPPPNPARPSGSQLWREACCPRAPWWQDGEEGIQRSGCYLQSPWVPERPRWAPLPHRSAGMDRGS